jgi:hypothetical protein
MLSNTATSDFRREEQMPASSINVRQLIVDQANIVGVPPGLAIAVASAESGIMQWYPNGSVVQSPKGAQGVFQLMPATAAGLNVDPTDLTQNISGGLQYLSQLYNKYGDWSAALIAYNWGPGNYDNYLNGGPPPPQSTLEYVSNITSRAGINNAALQIAQQNNAGSSPAPSSAAAPVSADDYSLTFDGTTFDNTGQPAADGSGSPPPSPVASISPSAIALGIGIAFIGGLWWIEGH